MSLFLNINYLGCFSKLQYDQFQCRTANFLLFLMFVCICWFFFVFFFAGCRHFTSMDGIWKLRFPHCMYPVETTVAGFEALNYPDVCTNDPYGKGSAFCAEHCLTAQKLEIPTNLREFLHQDCGVSVKNTGNLLFCHMTLRPFLNKVMIK